MKRALVLVLAIAAALAVAVPVVSARPATTAPGYNFKIDVTIKKGAKTVVLSRSLAKRGWLAHFVIHNQDTKAHKFDVGGLHPKKPVPAGGTAKVGAYLTSRGQYAVRVDGKLRGWFVVN